jgi:hypothetical protein
MKTLAFSERPRPDALERGAEIRFLGWSDEEGASCVHPLIPGDVGTIKEVITNPAFWPGASPTDPAYTVEYRKGLSHFEITHWSDEVEPTIEPPEEETRADAPGGTHTPRTGSTSDGRSAATH